MWGNGHYISWSWALVAEGRALVDGEGHCLVGEGALDGRGWGHWLVEVGTPFDGRSVLDGGHRVLEKGHDLLSKGMFYCGEGHRWRGRGIGRERGEWY